jgi:hypothetical protein
MHYGCGKAQKPAMPSGRWGSSVGPTWKKGLQFALARIVVRIALKVKRQEVIIAMLSLLSKMTAPPGRWPYLELATQQSFNANTFEHLLQQIKSHRKGVNMGFNRHGIMLDLEEGWEQRVERDICLILPEGWCSDPDNPEPYRTELERQGRKCWEELHAYALGYPENPTTLQIQAAKEWFKRWRYSIPNFHKCNCQKHFEEILTNIPLNLESRDSFYQTTVQWHNAVNARLGKPQWPYTS